MASIANLEALFFSNSLPIYAEDLKKALSQCKASDCDVLYVHSGMNFGIPNPKLRRSELLEVMADLLYNLNVKTLILPTYTFSFCEGATFSQESSKTPMGALNEYLRANHYWKRSVDPLMSNILFGQEERLINDIGKESIGKNSTFDLLSQVDGRVKFCFLGPRIYQCFTYMHFLEWELSVPYRYDFEFTGLIRSGTTEYEDTFTLFIRDAGVEAGDGARIFENMLVEKSIATRYYLGSGAITVTDLTESRSQYCSLLEMSPSFYIRDIYEHRVRSRHFEPRKLVAL